LTSGEVLVRTARNPRPTSEVKGQADVAAIGHNELRVPKCKTCDAS
jgi:hypothetical protein